MIEEDKVLDNVRNMSSVLFEYLKTELKNYKEFVELRGIGLMVGIEWNKPVADLVTICKEHGLLVLSAGPNVLRLLPPLNISKEELEQGMNILNKSIKSWL